MKHRDFMAKFNVTLFPSSIFNGNLSEVFDSVNEKPIHFQPPIINAEEIFDNICTDYLQNICEEENFCKDVHRLPTIESVQEKLKRVANDLIIEAFTNLLIPFEMLRIKYYATFAEYFGRKKDRRRLLEMLRFCTQPKYKVMTHLRSVVDGFVLSGMEYHDAIDMVLTKFRVDVDASEYSHILDIIVDERNKDAGIHCMKFEDVFINGDYGYTIDIFNRVLALTITTANAHLIHFARVVLENITITILKSLDQELVQQFLAWHDAFPFFTDMNGVNTKFRLINRPPVEY